MDYTSNIYYWFWPYTLPLIWYIRYFDCQSMDFGLKHSQKWDFMQSAIHINLIFVLLKSKISGERVNRFPFSAIVGQPLLKKSLILNAIDGSIGGVLIFGQRGGIRKRGIRYSDHFVLIIVYHKELARICTQTNYAFWFVFDFFDRAVRLFDSNGLLRVIVIEVTVDNYGSRSTN